MSISPLAQPNDMARPRRNVRGFSLAEGVMATAIVSVLMVAALNAAGGSSASQFRISQQRQGHLLCADLLAEISQQAYQEPGASTFGPESGETPRAGYDDVDDYAGYTDSPPKDRAGAAVANSALWRRQVEVAWVNPSTLAPAGADTGLKRITVTAWRADAQMASLVYLRGIGRDNLDQ